MTSSLDEDLDRRLGAFLVFLTCLCVSFRPLASGMTMELGSNLILHILVFFCAILWLVRAAMRGNLSWRSGTVAAAAVVFILICVLWTALAPRKMPAILTLISWTVDIALFLVVLQTTDDGARRTVLTCLLASAAVAACLGIAQYFWGFAELREILTRDPERVRLQLRLTEEMWPTYLARASNKEVFGTFVYPNALAGFLNVMIPIALGLFMGAVLALRRPVTGIALHRSGVLPVGTILAVMAVCLVLTFSKGGWIAAVPACLYVLFAAGCDTPKKKIAAAISCCSALVLLLVLGSLGDRSVLTQLGDSFNVRLGYWETGLRIAADNSFVKGTGLRSFGDHYAMYKKPSYYEVRLAHSTVFQLLVDTGVLGLLSYAALWFFLMKDAVKPKKEESRPSIRFRWTGMAAGITAFILLTLTLDISPFTQDLGGVDYAEWFGYLVLWTVAYLALDRIVVLDRPAVRIGLAGGCIGYLVHGMVDFDMFVPGVHQAALIAAACASGVPVRRRQLKGLHKAVLLGVSFAAAGIMALWLRGMLPGPDILGGESLKKAGRYHLTEGEMQKGLESLELAAKANPLDDEVFGSLINAYLDMSSKGIQVYRGERTLVLATKAAETAVRVNPLSSAHRFHLAGMLEKRNAEEALAHAREGVRLYPTKPKNRILLGDMLMRAGREDKARDEYAEAGRLNKLVNEPWLKLQEEDLGKIR